MKIYKRNLIWNLLLSFAAIMFFALGVTTLKEYITYGSYFRIAFISAPGIIIGLTALVSILRYKIILTDSYIIRAGFTNKKIMIDDIEEFEFLYDSAIVKTADQSIRLTKDLKNRNELIDLVYNMIKDKPEVKIIK